MTGDTCPLRAAIVGGETAPTKEEGHPTGILVVFMAVGLGTIKGLSTEDMRVWKGNKVFIT